MERYKLRKGQEPTKDKSESGDILKANLKVSNEKDRNAVIFAYSSIVAAAFKEVKTARGSTEEHAWEDQELEHFVDKVDLGSIKHSIMGMLHDDIPVHKLDMLQVLSPFLLSDRSTLLNHLLGALVQDGIYDARKRQIIFIVGRAFNFSDSQIIAMENALALVLGALAEKVDQEQLDEVQKEIEARNRRQKRNFYLKVGLGTLIGGVVIGLTGGLAAPLVAASAGAVLGTSAAVALGSTAGLAIIGSLFGAYGAGMTAYKVKKRSGLIKEFEFLPQSQIKSSLSVMVTISGWVTHKDPLQDFVEPWFGITTDCERYSLKYESEALRALGTAIEKMLTDQMVGVVVSEAIKHTALHTIMAAVAWPTALMKLGVFIDNPWSNATTRAQAAGVELAHALLSRAQGNRPVTLVGFSLGALAIFSCLQELLQRKHNTGIIHRVIILGAPVSGDSQVWSRFRSIVSGEIINGFSKEDWLLGFVCRGASFKLNIAGLSGISGIDDFVRNVDLTDMIYSHMEYAESMPDILTRIGLRVKPFGSPGVGTEGQRVLVPEYGYGVVRYTGQKEQDQSKPQVDPKASETVPSKPSDGSKVSAPEKKLPDVKDTKVEKKQSAKPKTNNRPYIIGIEFDEAKGGGDGSFQGKQLFETLPHHAHFFTLGATKIRSAEDSRTRGYCYSSKCMSAKCSSSCYSPVCRSARQRATLVCAAYSSKQEGKTVLGNALNMASSGVKSVLKKNPNPKSVREPSESSKSNISE